jgi:hypothetical protein
MFCAMDIHSSWQVEMPMGQFPKFLSAFVMLDVVAVYAYCLRIKGVYPPSHPWSGITLILLSVGLAGLRSHAQLPLWMISAAAVLSAGFWTVAAIQYR